MLSFLAMLLSYIFTFVDCAVRLTPVYMLVLAIYTTLSKYFGSGPFWPKDIGEACKTSWWTNLLYINNLVHLHSEVVLVLVLRNASIGVLLSTGPMPSLELFVNVSMCCVCCQKMPRRLRARRCILNFICI